MKIDGKQIAEELLQNLQIKVLQIKNKEISPALAVILVGDNPGSASYVRQKEKTAERIGATIRVRRYELGVKKNILQKQITELNADSSIHGIIIQRPLPKHLQDKELLDSINPLKDVDGFVPGSKFNVPVAMAVERILQQIYKFQMTNVESMQQWSNETMKQFLPWIQKQNIVVIGRGETAGKPIAEHLINQGCNVSVVHSQTMNGKKQHQIKNADIIISCVGKKRVITKKTIKQGSILISVGIWRDTEGKLNGDYEEDEIKTTASFYTPTPGGVGPVNVACLMKNLLTACISHPLSVH